MRLSKLNAIRVCNTICKCSSKSFRPIQIFPLTFFQFSRGPRARSCKLPVGHVLALQSMSWRSSSPSSAHIQSRNISDRTPLLTHQIRILCESKLHNPREQFMLWIFDCHSVSLTALVKWWWFGKFLPNFSISKTPMELWFANMQCRIIANP